MVALVSLLHEPAYILKVFKSLTAQPNKPCDNGKRKNPDCYYIFNNNPFMGTYLSTNFIFLDNQTISYKNDSFVQP